MRAAALLAQRIDQRIASFGVGHVQHHAAAAKRSQRFGDGGGARFGRGGADDGRAAGSQFLCDGAANAARGAGHQRDLALQFDRGVIHVFNFR
ncbi:hypothetical protein D3C87_1874280 [compost metagenome]